MLRIISSKWKLNRTQNDFIQNLIAKQSTVAAQKSKTKSITTASEDRIVIPKKINRGPTDLLYTLSRTVSRDPTAKEYKYHDDPYLLPRSIYEKDSFALAQESGKRTAQWIRNEHRELFNSTEAEPQIEAFIPKPIYTNDSDVDLKSLQESIDAVNVTDAVLIYKLLTANNVDIPNELKQSLLELVSFYNHQNPLPFDMFEERANKVDEMRKISGKDDANQWINNCFADELFYSIEPKTAAAYNTMLRALYKHGAIQRANELFNEAKQKEIPIDLATFNSHLRHIGSTVMSFEQRWLSIKSILGEINELRIKPNVHTLNTILATMRTGGNFLLMQKYAAEILAEFRHINVEPSLTTYWHLICISYNNRSLGEPNVMIDILNELEKNPNIIPSSVTDLSFFAKAVLVCRLNLKKASSLVHRLDQIVSHGDNVKLLGDPKQEQAYYRNVLWCILSSEPFESFIEAYDKLVPDIYAIEPGLMEGIFSVVNVTAAIEHIPKFWTDMIISGLSRRAQLTETILTIMVENEPMEHVEAHNHLNEQFADIAWIIYQDQTNEELTNKQKVLLHGARLAQTMILLLRANRYEDAKIIVERCLNQKDGNVISCLSAKSIEMFTDACCAQKQPSLAIKLIEYSIENGLSGSVKCAKQLVQSLTLSPSDLKRIGDLVGQDVVRTAPQMQPNP